MKRLGVILTISLAILAVFTRPSGGQEFWVGKDGSIRNVDSRAILIDKGEIYLATRNEVYRAKGADGEWEEIFSLPAGENEMRCLERNSKGIFVGTAKGLFRSSDRGRTWKRIFKTIVPDKSSVLSIKVWPGNPERIVLGSKAGVYISEDGGERWRDITGNIKGKAVRCLAVNRETIYAGGDAGLYVRKEGTQSWEKIFVIPTVAEAMPDDAVEDQAACRPETAEDEDVAGINFITLKDEMIYIGVNKEIYYSENGGKNWTAFSGVGLAGEVNCLLLSAKSDKFYCATTKGVFGFDRDKKIWLEVYKGAEKVFDVMNIAYEDEKENLLWALTDNGVYRLEGDRYEVNYYMDVERSLKSLDLMFDNEPTIAQLREQAVRYAEVNPEKIMNWRRESRLRALFPAVSFSVDKKRSTNSEIYTSATKDYVSIGPDDIANGWDISVSWKLGDLVWSDDQTNIDVRSKLMVQLRNDILDDLRRVYYERKRLQFELAMEPPQDIKTRFEKELRLKELTSAIDDLTGNYLSENIKKRSK